MEMIHTKLLFLIGVSDKCQKSWREPEMKTSQNWPTRYLKILTLSSSKQNKQYIKYNSKLKQVDQFTTKKWRETN